MNHSIGQVSNMNNILIVSNMYPSADYPYYGVFVKNTEEILKDNNYRVKVIGMSKKNKKVIKIIAYISFFIKVIFCLIFKKYDYVYVHFASFSSIPVLLSSKIKKLNIITNIHGNDLVPDNKKDRRMLFFSKKIFKISNKIIVPSEYFRQELMKIDNSYKMRTYIFPSGGLDTKVFKVVDKKEARRFFRLSEEKIYIGFIGRIEQDKGWDVFLELIDKFENRDIYFIIVGNGSEEPALYKSINQLKAQSKLLKFDLMEQEKVNIMLNAMDFFVFPTRRKSESLGLVGLESMATNTILLCSNMYGPSSYVKNGENCLTFNPYLSDDLYKTVEKALSLTDKEKKIIKENNFELIKKYEVNKISSKLVDILERE